MKSQMSQPIESISQLSPDGQPNEPTEKIRLHPPTKCTKKLAAFRTLAREAVAGRYEEEALHKARMGTNRPHVQRWIIRMHIILTAANCSPAGSKPPCQV